MVGVEFGVDFINGSFQGFNDNMKVSRNFLIQMLRLKGFSHKWIDWIKSFISGGSVAINVNDEVGPYFQTKKGLRQGDCKCI